jgi:hypothetical protein
MDEHVLAAVVAHDEAEALLRVEEFDDALALADDLRGHSASACAAATEAAAATAAAAIATATATAAVAACTAAAEATTVTVATAAAAAAKAATVAVAAAAAKAAALLETAAKLRNTFFAETVALVATATTALTFAPSIETHIRPNLNCPLTPETNALGQKGATGHDA